MIAYVWQACGCCCVCEAEEPSEGDDVSELNGWFTCPHNEKEEPGMKVFKLFGRQLLTGALLYREVSSSMIQ